jgi:hypothetical protein
MAASRVVLDRNGDTSRCRLIAGIGRSGTTWLADILISQVPARLLFEPFDPNQIPEYRDFQYLQYMRPDEENADLRAYCDLLFSGRLRNAWVDHQNEIPFPSIRIVKAIRANLMLGWIREQFPDLPIIVIMRHPCAVVNSRIKLGWTADMDVESMLSQPRLMADVVGDRTDIVRAATTNVEKTALLWAIGTAVALRQLRGRRAYLVFYEHLRARPEEELPKVFEAARLPFRPSVYAYANRPSLTSAPFSSIVTQGRSISSWRKELEVDQIDRILSIAQAFELGDLYSDRPDPLQQSRELKSTESPTNADPLPDEDRSADSR